LDGRTAVQERPWELPVRLFGPNLAPRTSPESPLAALTHSFRLQNAQNLNFQTTHPKKYLKLAGSYPDFFELLTA